MSEVTPVSVGDTTTATSADGTPFVIADAPVNELPTGIRPITAESIDNQTTPEEREMLEKVAAENLKIAADYAVRGAAEQKRLRQIEAESLGAAMQAFDTLFRYYSLNEELWRLERWMDGLLPYSLEDHPLVERYRELLANQVKHLRNDGPRITLEGCIKWYSEGSPAAGIDEGYVEETSRLFLPPRFQWLIECCRTRAAAKVKDETERNHLIHGKPSPYVVAEYGALEGTSLFHLIHRAPEIEWHGFETNPALVKRGHELADKCKIPGFRLHPMGEFIGAGASKRRYDAVALFEILEHNPWEGAIKLVQKCASAIKPGGTLFITTPHGNWSAWDAKTQNIATRKDHILAFTADRMLKLLTQALGPGEQEAEKVENPNSHENNAWVFCARTIK